MKKIKYLIKKILLKIISKINNIIKKLEKKISKLNYNITIIKYIKLSKYFDKKYYLENYKDVKISPYIHYYEIGWKERKNPSVKFDTAKYLENNPDIEQNNLCPLYHYEKYGKKEGRKTFYVDPQYNENYKTRKIRRYLKRKINNVIFHKKIKKNKSAKILVYIHIFYIRSINEIIEYLKNLEKYNYDLIISCTKSNHEKEIKEKILKFKPNATIYIFENRGFDIGPFIEVLNKTNLNQYDIIFKLQSKGTFQQTNFIYNQIFKDRDWFEYMFESTLGSTFVHKNIDLLLHNKNIGIIAANNLIIQDSPHKQNLTKKQLKKHNLDIKDNYYFVAGTCYVEKIELSKKIKELHLSINDFEPSEKGYFSFAHAIERYLTGSFNKKYTLYGNNTNKFKKKLWENTSNEIKNIIGNRIITSKEYNISDDFSLRFLEHNLISEYYLDTIKLKDIKREYQNKSYELKACSPYKFLKGETENYINYCLNNRRTDYMSLSKKEFIKYVKNNCIKDYNNTIKKIEKNGYDPNNPIIVDQNNNILDGQHRACYLLYKYGEEYEIKVLKLHLLSQNLDKIKPYTKLQKNIRP